MNINILHSPTILGSIFDSDSLENVSPEDLQEITRQTNLVTFVMLAVICVVFLIAVAYLVYFHKTTKKPKRTLKRFKSYKEAAAEITHIEKVPYYVHRYERPPEKSEYLNESDTYRNSLGVERTYKRTDRELHNKNLCLDEIRKDMDKPKNEAVEKFRYQVRYEFSTDVNNLYSGECFVYEESEDIKVGKTIQIKYDPTNPMINFSAYSAPVGVD